MTALEVLKTGSQVAAARAEMRRRGIDCATPLGDRILRRIGLLGGIDVGDRRKSWDVMKTVAFVERHVAQGDPVLDIGAFRSEILPVLHRLGYADLTGADLDPRIGEMPFAGPVRYLSRDFMALPCPDAAFACVTAISVIEHGFDAPRLLAEMSRIIRPGGFFVASVDYWPEKIDTSGIGAYGMDWRIFSREELGRFLAEAGEHGFVPCGDLDFEARDRVARWMGRAYTFAWLALQRRG